MDRPNKTNFSQAKADKSSFAGRLLSIMEGGSFMGTASIADKDCPTCEGKHRVDCACGGDDTCIICDGSGEVECTVCLSTDTRKKKD